MPSITIGTRQFRTPIFVPSVSSYETQINPADGLRIQKLINEPISLASAFDYKIGSAELLKAAQNFREQGVLLLDSGGYEYQRYKRWNIPAKEGEDQSWNIRDYLAIARGSNFDLTFSFDKFPTETDNWESYRDDLKAMLDEHYLNIDSNKLIPVVHLTHERSGSKAFDDKSTLRLIEDLTKQYEPQFIAIPERELGAGVIERAINLKIISRVLAGAAHIHVLGCGNPLSIALFAYAGASMMDGLEWCRTLVSPWDYHLHHFQHHSLFERDFPEHESGASFLVSSIDNYVLKTTIHNLIFLRTFILELRQALESNSLEQELRRFYGEGATKAVRAIRDA